MTKFLQKSFSVGVGGKEYSEGWERIFGKKKAPSCATCGADMTGACLEFAGTVNADGSFSGDYCVNAEDATGPIYCGQDCLPYGIGMPPGMDAADDDPRLLPPAVADTEPALPVAPGLCPLGNCKICDAVREAL